MRSVLPGYQNHTKILQGEKKNNGSVSLVILNAKVLKKGKQIGHYLQRIIYNKQVECIS